MDREQQHEWVRQVRNPLPAAGISLLCRQTRPTLSVRTNTLPPREALNRAPWRSSPLTGRFFPHSRSQKGKGRGLFYDLDDDTHALATDLQFCPAKDKGEGRGLFSIFSHKRRGEISEAEKALKWPTRAPPLSTRFCFSNHRLLYSTFKKVNIRFINNISYRILWTFDAFRSCCIHVNAAYFVVCYGVFVFISISEPSSDEMWY